MSERVQLLLASSHALREGRPGLPEINTHQNMLQTRWDKFQKETKKITANLELALKFHEVLFEVS